MATQTPTQRQAAAKRAAATRKRNAAKRSASATKTSARRTRGAAAGTARSTARSAGTTTTHAADTAAKAADAAGTQIGAVAQSAQRVLLIPVGAIAVAGDALRRTARLYSSAARRARQLDQLERRGARALAHRGLKVGRRAR